MNSRPHTDPNDKAVTGQQEQQRTGETPVAWPLRRLGLKVLDLADSLDYYIGSFLRHCLEQGIPLEGASDHLVSQALYLRDPEGNGIEVYADRPRESWQWKNDRINMATLRIDTSALLKLAGPFSGFPAQTCLGHMHLNVGELNRSQEFYQSFGMKLTANWMDQARFLSWDGYYHHLGINVWAGRNVQPVEPGVTGLDFFEIIRPPLQPGTFQDPDDITVVVSPPA